MCWCFVISFKRVLVNPLLPILLLWIWRTYLCRLLLGHIYFAISNLNWRHCVLKKRKASLSFCFFVLVRIFCLVIYFHNLFSKFNWFALLCSNFNRWKLLVLFCLCYNLWSKLLFQTFTTYLLFELH